jgi:N-acetyl-beta-hexosaminidase
MTKNSVLFAFALLFSAHVVNSQKELSDEMPVRGFCIAAPLTNGVDPFVKFIRQELVPRKINVLILRVDYNYQFETHPELRDSTALSKADVKKIVNVCKQSGISVIPQINLLGHQSWAEKTTNLLRVYPQFDETPHVKMPEKYVWPNEDGLYCKSYCPQHPDVHKIVFALVDEVCDAFESGAFHAGMDEVFYIGDEKCPRCGGKDEAELFADEVRLIRDHLNQKGRKLWMWGDRLIDGKTTGLGMWEASMNNTHRAVDMIPKDVMICDWHYERPDQTAVYFAMKGFNVATCPWRNPVVGAEQMKDMKRFRSTATPEMKERFQGIVQTIWSDTNTFLNGFYAKAKDPVEGDNTPWNCFRSVFPKQGTE